MAKEAMKGDLHIRCSVKMRETLDDIAEKYGMSLGDLVRKTMKRVIEANE